MGLWLLTFWDWGFEAHQGPGYLFIVSVEWCQVEISVTGRSLAHGSKTKCVCVCVSLTVIKGNNNFCTYNGYIDRQQD